MKKEKILYVQIMNKDPNIILLQLLKNEAATLSLAKSLMTNEEFEDYCELYNDSFKMLLHGFNELYPGVLKF